MHDGYAEARPVRVPVLVRPDLGPTGWAELHRLADQRGRVPRLQVLALLRWALVQSLNGADTEPTRLQLSELFDDASLEPVA
jgi:hypothetical protein